MTLQNIHLAGMEAGHQKCPVSFTLLFHLNFVWHILFFFVQNETEHKHECCMQ